MSFFYKIKSVTVLEKSDSSIAAKVTMEDLNCPSNLLSIDLLRNEGSETITPFDPKDGAVLTIVDFNRNILSSVENYLNGLEVRIITSKHPDVVHNK